MRYVTAWTTDEWARILPALLLYGALATPWPAAAAETDAGARLKAAIVYKLTKFVTWPDSVFRGGGEFSLCVVGQSVLASHLDAVRGKKTHGREIVVQRIEDIQLSGSCHLLWVSDGGTAHLPEILDRLRQQPVLTVSDAVRFAESGGVIGLVERNNRIGFDINLTASKQAGIEISSQLLDLAHIVE